MTAAASGTAWGRLPGSAPPRQVQALHDRTALPPLPAPPLLAHGCGRSYGDVALNPQGALLLGRGLDRFVAFDPATGVLECEAGVTLGELIAFALPRGWWPPVLPGTRFVTVGGAIANDVHGKNHHRAGSFGRQVRALVLRRSDGSLLRCSPTENAGLFAATIGGLGLTGLVVTAELQLEPLAGPVIAGESLKFGGLAEFFALAAESDGRYEHTVAWVDCLARGAALGRGLFLRGNPVPALAAEAGHAAPGDARLALPVSPPFSLIGSATLKAFNALYYGRQRARVVAKRWDWPAFFHPLDGIRDWNRAYGPRGFYQYQCVVPMAVAPAAIAEMLRRIAAARQGSFLAVLKVLGNGAPPGLLSFARPGATLALDFPNRGAETLALLDALDAVTREAGGALYPAKDARMSPAMFRASFPRLDEFRRWVDPGFGSALWRRVDGAGEHGD